MSIGKRRYTDVAPRIDGAVTYRLSDVAMCGRSGAITPNAPHVAPARMEANSILSPPFIFPSRYPLWMARGIEAVEVFPTLLVPNMVMSSLALV